MTLQEIGESNFQKTMNFIDNHLPSLLHEGICKNPNNDCYEFTCPTCGKIIEKNAFFYYPIIINRLYYSLLLIIKDKFYDDFKANFITSGYYNNVSSSNCNRENLNEKINEALKEIHGWNRFFNTIKNSSNYRGNNKNLNLNKIKTNMNTLKNYREKYDYEPSSIVIHEYETIKDTAKDTRELLCKI